MPHKHTSIKAVVYTDAGTAAWRNTGREEATKDISKEVLENVQRDMFSTPKVALFFTVRTSIMQLLEC